jgi:hypothetical protein
VASTVSDGTTVITPWFVRGYQAAQAGRNVFHDVIGKTSQDVTLFTPKPCSGTLSLYFQSWADAEACRALHAQATLFSFADTDVTSANMTYAIDSSGVQVSLDEDSLAWVCAVAFQEVIP